MQTFYALFFGLVLVHSWLRLFVDLLMVVN